MSNASPQSDKLAATLILSDAKRLNGNLTALLDGRLQWESAQPLHHVIAPDAPTLVPGSPASLSLAAGEAEGGLPEPAAVKIAGQYGGRITLEFAPSDTTTAQRFRTLIENHCDSHPPSSHATSSHTISKSQSTSSVALEPLDMPAAEPTPPDFEPQSQASTAQYRAILERLERRSLEELELALTPFFTDLTTYLIELSSRIKQPRLGENPHYEAATIIRRSGPYMSRHVVKQLSDYYRDLTPLQSEDRLWQYTFGSSDELDIIDLQEFEDFLALDRMVTLSEELHRVPLEALTVRIATLANVDPNKLRLPIHVRQLCRAFQKALMDVKIPTEVLTHIYDYFSKQFIRQLDGFYQPLNSVLAEEGVRPNVEAEIQHRGSLLKRNREPQRLPRRQPKRSPPKARYRDYANDAVTSTAATAAGESATPSSELDLVHQQLGKQLTGTLHHSDPANLYRSVVDALNFKREAEGLTNGAMLAAGTAVSGTWEGATVPSSDLDQTTLADAQLIARALTALQHDSRAREDVQRSDSLRAYLASNKQNIGGLKNTSGLTAESLNQLDMVDNLFGTIRSQLDVNTDLKPALGNLQIPLAKLALLDPKFFVDHSHSARAVVDKLSQLAASANFPNKALEGRISNIVDEIVADYENDASVFEHALTRIDRLAAQQQRALLRNIERVVRTQEGQEKLAQARQEVAKLIASRIQPPAAPQLLIDLIEAGWQDLLVFTHVKSGPKHTNWTEQVRFLDQLCQWLEELQQGEIDGDLDVQRGLEAGPLLDLIGQQISSALPTSNAHEPVIEALREILSGNGVVEMAAITAGLAVPEPGDVRAKIEDLPRLRRWVKRVEQLQISNWLTYRDKNNNKKRMQLAWISPARDRYIFVNERGQKIADLSAIRLARQLSRGVQPPAPADRLSVVDKSMYHTLEHVQKTLSFARNHDSLTRLINRETFLEQMNRALRHTQRKSSAHAVLYLNIDQFNLVNDVYDRLVGDQVLLEFARLLAQLHGKKSSSARLEADEFAVLLLDRTLVQAETVADKIRSDIEASSVDIEGENVSFTVSIGVTAIREFSADVDTILSCAQTAMRRAKQLGRNRVARFDEEQGTALDYGREKTRLRKDLEQALATERFVLRAQPIVQTAVRADGDSSQHYELLLGLTNKDGSISSPQEFIQSAERYGFMTMVDRWVVREAFSWISSLMDAQKVVPNLAINLSGSSVTDDSFMEYLLEQISEFGVGTSRLCFEITETGTISNLVKAADFVRAFRNIGCKFSIDDFGTGLASHNYLRELPVDYVKIDGSFVTGIHKNRNDYAMARSINDLAHFLGQETIAESVENDEIIAKLEEIGVDYLQGWGIGKPKKLSEVTADLSNLDK